MWGLGWQPLSPRSPSPSRRCVADVARSSRSWSPPRRASRLARAVELALARARGASATALYRAGRSGAEPRNMRAGKGKKNAVARAVWRGVRVWARRTARPV